MNNYFIECHGVSYSYLAQNGLTKTPVLKDFSCSIKAGDSVAITGQSGCGKSTLLNLLAGLDVVDSGVLSVLGQELKLLNPQKCTTIRRDKMGFIYQFHHLLEDFNALDNIAMPLLIQGKSLQESRKYAKDLLAQIQLSDRANHHPNQLSGGQRQRIAVARALVTQPQCILADEPTGNLDKDNADSIINLLLNANQNNNTTLIIVTHDHHIAKQLNTNIHLNSL